MKVEVLQCREALPAWLEASLTRFEEQFIYPLGGGASFRISHGSHYLTFFRAMGQAMLLVAHTGEEVLGTLVGVVRRVRFGHAVEPRSVIYICDLKVLPGSRRGVAYLKLAGALQEAARSIGIDSAFGVVMGGSAALPDGYTGRCQIPPFARCGEIMIYRIPVPSGKVDVASAGIEETTMDEVGAAFRSVMGEGAAAELGDPNTRSSIQPVALVSNRPAVATGLLEDTRLGKRLWMSTGEEWISAHLSCFAWAPGAEAQAAALVHSALKRAGDLGFPALFLSVPASRVPSLWPWIAPLQPVEAPATVFGFGCGAVRDWWINTAEI